MSLRRTLLTTALSTLLLLAGCAGNWKRAGYDYHWQAPARVPVYLATEEFSYDLRGTLEPARTKPTVEESQALDHAISQWNAALVGRVELYRAGSETAFTNVVTGVHVRTVSDLSRGFPLTDAHPPNGRAVLELLGLTTYYLEDSGARVLGRTSVAIVTGLTGVKLRQVYLHELGHALGLRGHVLSVTAVMRPVDGLFDRDTLTERDIAELQRVYE